MKFGGSRNTNTISAHTGRCYHTKQRQLQGTQEQMGFTACLAFRMKRNRGSYSASLAIKREAASYSVPPAFKRAGDFMFLCRNRFTSQILCASPKSVLNRNNTSSPLLGQVEWKSVSAPKVSNKEFLKLALLHGQSRKNNRR